MRYLHKIKDKACEALDTIGQSADKLELMDGADRKLVCELICLVKDIGKIEDMEGGSRHSSRSYAGSSYENGSSYRRDSMGRYSREARDEMLEHAERAMSAAPDPEMKRIAKEFMEKLDRM